MDFPNDLLARLLPFGLVIGGLVAAWLISAALGGWKFGKFLRQAEFSMDRAQLLGFTERLQRRLAELGFVPTGVAGEFMQGGADVQDPGAFTHARTPKVLRITLDDSAQPHAKVLLALQYQNSIVADTGEGNYRDAVLDYISGQTDAMKVVPNRSFMAVCTLVGGVTAWVTLLAYAAIGFRGFFQPVLVVGPTYFLLGIYAIVAILRKPGQATGLPWAIGGVITSASALIAAFALKLLNQA